MHRLSANRAVKILWRPVVSLSQRQSVLASHASRSRLTPGFNANLTTKLNSAGMKVTVDLPEMMLRALSTLARAEDVTVGQLVRDAITVDLRLRAKPKRDDRTDAAARRLTLRAPCLRPCRFDKLARPALRSYAVWLCNASCIRGSCAVRMG